MSTTQPLIKQNNEVLRILRVLACVGVVATHIGQVINVPEIIKPMCTFGAQGPYLFFVISGFLMMKSKELKEGNIKAYYQKRLLRIMPAYYFSLICHFILYSVGERKTIEAWTLPEKVMNWKWLRYLFCVNIILPTNEECWSNMGSVWSVSCFLFFYLLAPFFYRFINNRKRALLALVIFMGISALWKSDAFLPDLLASTIPYFLSGILVYIVIYEDQREPGDKSKKKLEDLLIIILVLLVIFIYKLPDRFFYWIIFMICVAISEEIKNVNIYGWAKSFLEYLDKRSYGIYLMHPLVLLVIKGSVEISGWDGGSTTSGNIILLLVVIVGVLLLTESEYRLETILKKKIFAR